MLYLTLAIFAAVIVALDQLTKYLTVAHIPLGGIVDVLPGVFHFTYVQNTGAAFSILEGKTWFFYIITAVFLVLVVLCVWKKWLKSKAALFSLAAITGGAVGNLIDRAVQGYVVDMIEVEFIRFAVFNVADCFITCGAIALVIFVFLEDKMEKSK